MNESVEFSVFTLTTTITTEIYPRNFDPSAGDVEMGTYVRYYMALSFTQTVPLMPLIKMYCMIRWLNRTNQGLYHFHRA